MRINTVPIKPIITLLLATILVACAATQTAQAPPSPMGETAGGRLVSQRAATLPAVDGQVDAGWADAESLRLPLTWGIESTAHALDVELRTLHTDQEIAFLAQWSGEPPSGEAHTVLNKLTLHWIIPEPAAQHLDCTVVCHTAFADGNGHFVYANAETIPHGGSETLPAAGRWEAGTWTLEWSRPLLSDNPFDLQFDDLDREYSFLVKVFESIEGRPDPVSDRHPLVFRP
jgi:hypothetical protein